MRWLAFLALLPSTTAKELESDGLLGLFDKVLISTARQDFSENDAAFGAALRWDAARLSKAGRLAPYLACAQYGNGLEALVKLTDRLSEGSVRRLSNSPQHGTCFVATASPEEAISFSERPESNGLSHFVLFPSVLKLSPGLLDHDTMATDDPGVLTMTHGYKMRHPNVHGVRVELSPGVLEDDISFHSFVESTFEDLMSRSLDLRSRSFWTDSGVFQGRSRSNDQGSSADMPRVAREWARAADLVHEFASTGGRAFAPSEACSWGGLGAHRSGANLMITGAKLCSLPRLVRCL